MGSQERLMTIMWRLLAGQTLTKQDLMAEFGKDESIIRRDIAVIKHSWQATQPADGAGEGTLIVSPAPGQYRMQRQLAGTNVHFEDSELLAMLLILTNSRALNNDEMSPLLAKLVASGQDHALLDWLTKNDRVFYRGVPASPLLGRLLTLGQAIRRHETITFTYTYEGQAQHFSALTPTGLYFGDLFFYLVTGSDHQPDDPDRGTFTRFRISRISQLVVTPQNRSAAYTDRFEASRLRAQTGRYPYLGEPIILEIEYHHDPHYVIDRFPDAVVEATLPQPDEQGRPVHRIRIPANDGYGLRMWLLAQAGLVRVLSPRNIREYVVACLQEALGRYDG